MTEQRHEGIAVATLAEHPATDALVLRITAVEPVAFSALLAVMQLGDD